MDGNGDQGHRAELVYGRWVANAPYPGDTHVIYAAAGQPNPWITLRARGKPGSSAPCSALAHRLLGGLDGGLACGDHVTDRRALERLALDGDPDGQCEHEEADGDR